MQLLYDSDRPNQHGEIGADALIALYRHDPPVEAGRVWLRTNFVSSLDGSVQGPDGRSGSINTPSDQYVFALHRAWADAILVGASTVRNEGYRAVDLAPWQREIRARAGLAGFPTLVVISRSAHLDPGIAAPSRGELGHVLVVTTTERTAAEVAPLRAAGIEVLQLPGTDVELRQACQQLMQRGLLRVLCEGGPALHRDLLAAGLVDELSLTLAPVAVGGVGLRSTNGAALPGLQRFVLRAALRADDGALFTQYRRIP